MQSETELAVLDSRNSRGQEIVVGYNDSYGFYDNRQGLSGYSYSTNGGRSFIDASGLPPVVNDGSPFGTPGSDSYAGDPVVVVHNATETFHYASIYITPNGFQTLAVNRGHFGNTPPSPSRAGRIRAARTTRATTACLCGRPIRTRNGSVSTSAPARCT